MKIIETDPKSPLAYMGNILPSNTLFIDRSSAVLVTERRFDKFIGELNSLADLEEQAIRKRETSSEWKAIDDMLWENSHRSFFHKTHDLELLHEQFHYYQLCNCNYLFRIMDNIQLS
ncbi:MAG: hypothetical protein QM758_14370 [Armatimonas sp.]